MEKEQLLRSLDALRTEVAQASEIDPEMLSELRRLTDAMRQSLDDEEPTTDTTEQASHGLKDLLLKFESDHPQLSAAVGKVADALAAMGF
jgi:hypothetical protein